VPAVLFRYTQVLRRPDLLNHKGKPLVSTAQLEAVWKRLSDRFATVVADTSMITLSTAYTTHFHDIFIDGVATCGDSPKLTSPLHTIVYSFQFAIYSSQMRIYCDIL
jgi:hypothetical protein